MPVVTKIKSKVIKKVEEVVTPFVADEVVSETEQQSGLIKKATARKKRCYFCAMKVEPVYWDSSNLRRYVNDRGRIVPKTRTGACAKHQRRVATHIKYARHLSLLPFLVRV